MKRSTRIALTASLMWVVAIWCVWLFGDFNGGETQIAMLAGLAIILGLKIFVGSVADKKSETDP